ncbi:non-ribosomal peptide synthetase [Dictyobacter aurantiacus]|uniref:Carrier domain-containing protein n=1 Tax=Dictyobacter aurantiacus TaxID=1936993 RepID=A0A401ZKP5_9CHLR|nr:non-ribosomal peptide synthetase [Dictyobacter aurantiacus]GCE07390.1 hypothetical protein KDAU_47190 [Dictyobacter aurantiacus]
MTDLARRLASLSPEQRAMLEQRLQQKQRAAQPEPTIAARGQDSGPLPLSFEQQRLWFTDQLAPGNAAYNSPLALRLLGELDSAALHRALKEIVRRHEVLRTSFGVHEDGQPVQLINPDVELPLPINDLRDLPEAERTAEAYRLACEEAQRPFDIVRGPIVRARLLALGEREHVLVLAFHHIAVDAWSIVIFFRELAALYDAYRQQRQLELPPLALQYADYALWQRQTLRGPRLEELLGYWREHLSNLPTLRLPTDRPRQPGPSSEGVKRTILLPASLKERLRAIGQRNQATLFMVLLTGFQILLTRYSGQEEIVIGTSVAGRSRRELEDLIGFFINMLVLRTELPASLTFNEALQRVRAECLRAYAHQDLPFERLVQELHPERDPGRMPLFQVLFQSVESVGDGGGSFPGLDLEPFALQTGTSKFDLLVSVREPGDEISIEFEYNTALFNVGTIERMLNHYQTLLVRLASRPEQRIQNVPLLTEEERRVAVEDWNQTQTAYPTDRCLHQLFEEQARRQPRAVAVSYEEQELSYASLDARANQLAHYLQRLGVGPDVIVGLCVERSIEMVVGILGILKAGGAYAPLDPNYPRERLAFMLGETRAPVVLTQQRLLTNLPEQSGLVVCLDADWKRIEAEPQTPPVSGVGPRHLAYVISTSGSTGTPKGIAIQHQGVVNNITDLNRRFNVGPDDSVLGLSSLSFDMCVYEVLGLLAAGGTLVLPPLAAAKDPACWADMLVRKRVTLWNSAPSLLVLLANHCEQLGIAPLPLRLALLGGDWVPVSLPERLKALAPGIEFITMGGATEASIHSIIYPVEETDPGWKSIPYGRPMANQEAYILDANAQLVPIGVAGELHLGGAGLARGYLNQPALTAEKFVPHPFSRQPGQRLYKTGDLARYREDGVIELLGRMDFLVKIRGLRIELGEIEATLKQHAAVREAVVVVREDHAGDRQLVAYIVVPEGEAQPQPVELRALVKGRLPEYMQPAAYVFLARLPLSPNGKVDRKALPAPDQAQRQPRQDIVPPADELERRLTRIWSDVLGIEQISVTDNFFELGGDSFKAIRAARACSETLPLIDFFTHATIRELAAHLRRSTTAASTHLLYELMGRQDEAQLSLVCVPYGGGNVVAYQTLANSLPPGYRLYSVALPGHDFARREEPLLPLEEVAHACVEEIVQTVGKRPLALYGQCAGVALTIEIARLLEERGHELAAVYLGAALPDRQPTRSIEMGREVPDDELLEWLQYLGGFEDLFESDDTRFILNAVRHDLLNAAEYYRRAYEAPAARLRAPVTCIVGSEDAATREYSQRYREWEYFGAAVNLQVIEGARHYFVKHNASELAEIIYRATPIGGADQHTDGGQHD